MPQPQQHKGYWRCNFWHEGRRHQRRFPDQGSCQEYIDNVINGRVDDTPLQQQIQAYLRWGGRVKAPGTIVRDEYVLRIFSRFTNKAAGQVTVNDIRGFQDWFYQHRPFHGKPVRSDGSTSWMIYLRTLKTFFNWCATRGWVQKNPCIDKTLEVKTTHKPPTVYTDDEIREIFRYLERYEFEIRAFFYTLLHTGLRLGEAEHLTWEAVDLANRVIRVHSPKTDTTRSVPINSALLPILQALPKEGPFVFGGKAPKYRYQSGRWWKILRRATDKGSCHTFRHTFAANLAIKGVPINQISALLGHRNLRTTQIYLHFAPRHLDSAVESIADQHGISIDLA